MQPQSGYAADETEHELNNLNVCDNFLPRRGAIDAAKKVVRVHDDMNRRVRKKSNDLQALGVLEPEEAHEYDRRVMEHM